MLTGAVLPAFLLHEPRMSAFPFMRLLHAADGVAITDRSTRVENEALRASFSVTL